MSRKLIGYNTKALNHSTMKKYSLIVLVLLLANNALYGQKRAEAYLTIGKSALRSSANTSLLGGDLFEFALAYSAGITGYHKILSSSLDIMIGAAFTSYDTKTSDYIIDNSDNGINSGNGINNAFAEKETSPENERNYSITFPIGLNFQYEEWLHLYGGLLLGIYLSYSDNKNMYYNIKSNTTGFTAGLNIVLLQRYSIGINYTREMTPLKKMIFSNETLNFHQISGRIGYFFFR